MKFIVELQNSPGQTTIKSWEATLPWPFYHTKIRYKSWIVNKTIFSNENHLEIKSENKDLKNLHSSLVTKEDLQDKNKIASITHIIYSQGLPVQQKGWCRVL